MRKALKYIFIYSNFGSNEPIKKKAKPGGPQRVKTPMVTFLGSGKISTNFDRQAWRSALSQILKRLKAKKLRPAEWFNIQSDKDVVGIFGIS